MNKPLGDMPRFIDSNALGLIAILMLLVPVNSKAAFTKVAGIDDSRIRRVCVSKTNPGFMAVASDNALYLSSNGGDGFKKATVLKDERINNLFIDSDTGTTVYLAGSRKGYRISQSTEKIFTANENEEIHCIRKHGHTLYAGTSEGLYHADETLLNWQPVPSLRNSVVYSMEPSGNDLYLACDSGVYLYRSDGSLKRLFVTRNTAENGGITPLQIKVDTMSPSRLWLCTTKGVYSSNDRGLTWQKTYINGAGSVTAYCLAQFPLDGSHFYLCSETGFYKINIPDGTSSALFEGLPTSNILWTDLTSSGDIFLATDQGLFKQTRSPAAPAAPSPSIDGLEELLQGEPSIHEVQEAAMRYNSVHPDKTSDWRNRIKYRALMPRLSVDYDKTIGSSFTSSGYYYAQGPYDWGVSLTWDMGNLIWNSYEDDIDNRTKLTTQLRMDILDEVNRLYFERLRLKHEIMVSKLNQEETTVKELRLYELTATLDGYTGGLYSQ